MNQKNNLKINILFFFLAWMLNVNLSAQLPYTNISQDFKINVCKKCNPPRIKDSVLCGITLTFMVVTYVGIERKPDSVNVRYCSEWYPNNGLKNTDIKRLEMIIADSAKKWTFLDYQLSSLDPLGIRNSINKSNVFVFFLTYYDNIFSHINLGPPVRFIDNGYSSVCWD